VSVPTNSHDDKGGSPVTRTRSVGRALAVCAAVTGLLVAFGAPASARDGIEVLATVDNHDLARSSPNRPVPLQDRRPAVINVKVTNGSAREILVRSVRLQGVVIGLTMFSYEARVDLRVPASRTEEVTYEIELVDLSRQAVGLIPARVELLDGERDVLATQNFESDVDGSARSVYGLFGLVIAAITAVLLVSGLVRLAGNRLPANRWKRGARFGVVGLGAGLTVTFTLSAFGILFPTPGLWTVLLLVGGVAMLAFGYVTPDPGDDSQDGATWEREVVDDASQRIG
jgi:hypothetical protein